MKKFQSLNPATGETLWEGVEADAATVTAAVATARAATEAWAGTSFADRLRVVESYREKLLTAHDELAALISNETGKPLWEAHTEATAMAGKISLSVAALQERCGERESSTADKKIITRFNPHGVVAVFGPFNFPGHLPNGHIVPALLAGNTVVFKPSEQTPAVAEFMTRLWQSAGLPSGVLTLLQGAGETGKILASHPDLDGIFFTGSSRTGAAIQQACVGQNGRILALEMGGNNPLLVWDISPAQRDAAVCMIIQSAFITAGQRCTCARRLIVAAQESAPLLATLKEKTRALRVATPDSRPEPFVGCVISAQAATHALAAQEDLRVRGGKVILPLRQDEKCPALLQPGIMDVTDLAPEDRPDEEIFAPFLQVIRVADFSAALAEANHTRYGLAAGLLSDRAELYKVFQGKIRAGIVNWNQPTTGASGAAPFGGIGCSGNHRPGAYFAADYCAYPVASIETERLAVPTTLPPGLSL